MSERVRLRPAYPDELLGKYYAKPHSSFGNADHRLRLSITAAVARAVGPVASVADLACGDGAITSAINAPQRYLGDMGSGYPIEGPIESTIDMIPKVDLFVCTETIEHLDDPDMVLKAIRAKTTWLLLSTPVGCFHDTNPEHYWAWSKDAVEEMLTAAGFSAEVYASADFTAAGPDHYNFGIWLCR